MPAPGQFTLSRIFLATLLAAIVLALLAPRIRAWPADAQFTMALMVGPASVFLLGLPAILLWRAGRTYQRAGELLHRARPAVSYKSMRIVALVFLFLAAVQFVIIDSTFAGQAKVVSGIEVLIAQMLGNLLFAECLWFTAPIPAECRTGGLLTTRLHLFPWGEIASFRTREKPPAFFIVSRHTTIEIPVTKEDLAPMEAILAERVR